jgi:hypothetical protein
MTGESFDTLGPAERHIADQMRKAVNAIRREAERMIETIDQIDLDQLDVALLDHDKKKMVIDIIDPMQRLATNISQGGLVPLIAKVVINDTEVSA